MSERKPNCHCNVCNAPIYRRPSQIKRGNVFCSIFCAGKFSRKNEKPCPICGKIIFGNLKTCSRSCSNKNRCGIKYDNINRYNKANKSKALKEKISKIRGGTCEKCYNDNYNILQIHHVLEKARGGTDEENNLLLLCPNCHMTKHLGYSRYGE